MAPKPPDAQSAPAKPGRSSTLLAFLLPLPLLHLGHRAALVRVRVLDDAVGLAPLVVLRQMLGDRKAFLVHEQQAVAVLVFLHLVARADPAAELGLFLGVGIEVTGAQR